MNTGKKVWYHSPTQPNTTACKRMPQRHASSIIGSHLSLLKFLLLLFPSVNGSYCYYYYIGVGLCISCDRVLRRLHINCILIALSELSRVIDTGRLKTCALSFYICTCAAVVWHWSLFSRTLIEITCISYKFDSYPIIVLCHIFMRTSSRHH